MITPKFSNAQWVQTSGPSGDEIRALFANGTNLFAGTFHDGIFLSTNNGNSWTAINSGLPENLPVGSIAANGSILFAEIGTSLFRSTDNGANWTKADSGLPEGINGYCLISKGNYVFASTINGIYCTSNNGYSWTPVNSGFFASALVVVDEYLFASTEKGISFSTDNGLSWVAANTGLPTNNDYYCFAIKGSTIYAGSRNGVYLSTNHGGSWIAVNSGLPDAPSFVNSIAISGTNLFAGTGRGIFISGDNGNSWAKVNDLGANMLLAIGTDLFAGTAMSGVFRSTDNGKNWVDINSGFPVNGRVLSLAVNGTNLYSGTYGSGIFKSDNNGTTWKPVNTNLPWNTVVTSFVINGTEIFAGTSGNGIYRSTDNGANWNAIDSGLPEGSYVSSLATTTNGSKGINIFAGLEKGEGVYRSTDNGATWTAINSGFNGYSTIVNLSAIGPILFASGIGGIGFSYEAFRSNDYATWTAVNLGLPTDVFAQCFVSYGNKLFAGFYGKGIFCSTDNGSSWTAIQSILSNHYVNCFFVRDTNLFAGTDTGIFISTDNGSTWSAFNEGLPANLVVHFLDSSGPFLFAGTEGFGVWRYNLSNASANKRKNYQLGQLNFNINLYCKDNNVDIKYILPQKDRVTVKIYNLSGHEMATLVDKNLESGSHSLTWDTKNTPAGCYTVRMQVGGKMFVKSVPIFR